MYLDHLVYYNNCSAVGTVPNLAPNTYGTLNGTTTGLVASTDIVRGVGGGKATEYDGATEYTTISNHVNINFGTNSFTIFIWLMKKGDGSQAFPRLLNKYGSLTGYEILSPNATDVISFIIGDSSSSATASTVTALTRNMWHCLACVVDRSDDTSKVYLDGDLDSAETDISSIGSVDVSKDLSFGYANTGQGYAGLLDYIMFFNNIALTKTQILDLKKRTYLGRI